MTTIVLKDFDLDKEFLITPLKGWKAFSFLNTLLALVAKTKELDPGLIKQTFMRNFGEKIESDHTKDDEENLNKMDQWTFIFNLVKSILIDLDDYKQEKIAKVLISCVKLKIGENAYIQLTLDVGSDINTHISHQLQNPANYYKLFLQVLLATYDKKLF